MRVSGFEASRSAGGAVHGKFIDSDNAIAPPIDHMPVASSDTSTTVACPVFSRWNSAPMIAPAIVIAPIESPNAGAGGMVTLSSSGRFWP